MHAPGHFRSSRRVHLQPSSNLTCCSRLKLAGTLAECAQSPNRLPQSPEQPPSSCISTVRYSHALRWLAWLRASRALARGEGLRRSKVVTARPRAAMRTGDSWVYCRQTDSRHARSPADASSRCGGQGSCRRGAVTLAQPRFCAAATTRCLAHRSCWRHCEHQRLPHRAQRRD
jgi:hypothetical protein